MNQRMDIDTGVLQSGHLRQIAAMRRQQCRSQGRIQGRDPVGQVPVLEDLARQRVPVCVESRRGDTEHGVAEAYAGSVDDGPPVDNADHGSYELDFILLIHAGQLGGIAAEQGTAGIPASCSHSTDHVGHYLWVQVAGAHVVEEEEGAGPLHQNVVHAMVDDVMADGFVAVQRRGDLGLGADAVDAALASGDYSAAQFDGYSRELCEAMEVMRKLVYAYYDEQFNFAHFLERHPARREDLVNLLVGNVFRRPVDAMFEEMSEMCRLPEARRLEGSEPAE